MKNSRLFLVILGLMSTLGSCGNEDPVPPDNPSVIVSDDFFYKAVDASFIPQIREAGYITFSTTGDPEDMLTTLQKAGVNTIRIRLWHTPADGHSGLEEVIQLAKEVRNKGMKVWLCVHYSDSWADPQKQVKPKAWRNLTFDQLNDSVGAYTRRVASAIIPDLIQIGNEINNGFLWPEGSLQNATQFTQLINTGIAAAREVCPQAMVMLHIAGPGEAEPVLELFQQTNYDIIGLSYYPIWHGKNLLNIEATIYDIQHRYLKPVVIAETAYPFTLGWNDFTNNIIGSANQILPDFNANPADQRDYLQYISTMMQRLGKNSGFCYWGGEWIAFKGAEATNGSTWENQALWDFDGKPLPALEVFKN